MRGRRGPWSKAGASLVALAVLVIGAVAAQDNPAGGEGGAGRPDQSQGEGGPEGPAPPGPRLASRPRGSARRTTRWPPRPTRAPRACRATRRAGPCRRRARSASGSRSPTATGEPLAASYYPSKLGDGAPVDPAGPRARPVEQGLRGADRRPPEGLPGRVPPEAGVRGPGRSTSGATAPTRGGTSPRTEWPAVVNDLQVAYHCLVDRHNRGDLNVAPARRGGPGRGGQRGHPLGGDGRAGSPRRGGPATSARWSWSRRWSTPRPRGSR